MIQQGIQFHMPVKMNGLDLADVSSIEFLFKMSTSNTATAIKSSLWKSDGTGDAQTGQNNLILIPWSKEDTYKIPEGRSFYFHARVHYNNTTDNPYIPVVELTMDKSLFNQGEVVEND